MDRLVQRTAPPPSQLGDQQLPLASAAGLFGAQSGIARSASDAGSAQRGLANSIRPSGGSGRNVRGPRTVLRHGLHRQWMDRTGPDRWLGPMSARLLHYLGSALVDQKTNEIPVAQQALIPPLDLENRFVSLDALHTQAETARTVVLEAGGHYLLTVKDNQPILRANIEKKVSAPQADFPP